MTEAYTQALADLERQRGLQEITNEQYLEAKAKIEAERYKAGKPVRIFAGTRRLHQT
jgi:hypothetical protein